MFYGIYYGVLGRDMAESCTDRMAAKIGVRLAQRQRRILMLVIRLVLFGNGSTETIVGFEYLCSLC